MAILKTLTVNGAKYEVAPIVPASRVTLSAARWESEGDIHHQVVAVAGTTDHTKVDLQPDPDQLAEFHYLALGFVAENDGGVVTVYAIGDRPTKDYTLQITLSEVDGVGTIRGNTVGTTMPRANMEQTDPSKADYVFGKEAFITDAIARAKANGEFDGKDGYTPVKGVDYFDGEKGDPGRSIDDVVSLEVGYIDFIFSDGTAKSINISDIIGGSVGGGGGTPGVGISAVVGETDEDGDTLVTVYNTNNEAIGQFLVHKGNDYILTDDDKDEIANKVLDLLGINSVILPETYLAEDSDAGDWDSMEVVYSFNIPKPITTGKKYIVTIDGVNHTVVAENYTEETFVTNGVKLQLESCQIIYEDGGTDWNPEYNALYRPNEYGDDIENGGVHMLPVVISINAVDFSWNTDCVKTINGIAPDENGNVEIAVSGGNVDTSGKKWLFIGDSITEHNFRASKNYDEFLSEWLGIESINRGMSSTGVTHSLTSSPTWLDDLPNYPTDVDCISVMGALNDRHTPLGEWGDRGINTVFGGVWNYFNNLITKYPNKPIIYITSTPREYSYGVDGQYTAWVDAFIKTAHNFSIPVLDLYRESGLRPWNATNNKTYFSCSSSPDGDGVHPNELGQELMARKIYDFAKVHLFGLSDVNSGGGNTGGGNTGGGDIVDTGNGWDAGDESVTGAWELGALSADNTVNSTTRIRTVGVVCLDNYDEMSVSFDASVYKVATYYYDKPDRLISLNTASYDTTGEININSTNTPAGTRYMRLVLARVDDAIMTVDEASAVTVTATPKTAVTGVVDTGEWELGAIVTSEYSWGGNQDSNTRIRTVGWVRMVGYHSFKIVFDASVYKMAVYYYSESNQIAVCALNMPSWDTAGEININSTNTPAGTRYMRLVLARVDDAIMTVDEASAVTVTGVAK